MKQSNPKPTDHYSEKNIANFLRENFAGNQVMRYRLTNIIAGVREQAYQQGRKDAMRKSEVITEDVIMQKRETI